MRRCAKGYGGRTAWRSKTRLCIRWCVHASGPCSRSRAPVTPKKPDAIPEFQATGHEPLQRVIPPANTRPIRVCSQDESRFGLLTVRRRRLTACNIPPVGPVQHVFEWCYVYGAVAAVTGERFCLELPSLNADMFQLFLDAFAQALPDSLNILLLDNSGAHTAQRLRWPDNVYGVWLPPDCPEHNPIERVWRDLQDKGAWEQFADLTAQLDDVADLLQAYDAATLHSLSGDPYLADAINARYV
jgi:transposase